MPFCQSLPASPGQSVVCFLSLQISLPFIEFHLNRIIHNIPFCDCLFSLIRATSLLQHASTSLLLRVESVAQSVVSRLTKGFLTYVYQQNMIKGMLCNLFHPTHPLEDSRQEKMLELKYERPWGDRERRGRGGGRGKGGSWPRRGEAGASAPRPSQSTQPPCPPQ